MTKDLIKKFEFWILFGFYLDFGIYPKEVRVVL